MLIAQITDTHIVEKDTHYLSEPSTCTRERLMKVVAHLNGLNPAPDVALLTGDASDTGTSMAYSHLKELLKPLNIPIYIIPGNHDNRDEMRKSFSQTDYMPAKGYIHYVIDNYPVRLIGLDTHVPDEPFGRICEERLYWLEEVLNDEKERPTLLFMHHPPVKTGTKLFDQINCSVPQKFIELIKNNDNILAIVSGHYHHFCVSSIAGKPCFIAPSVAPVHYFAAPHVDEVTALELDDPAITLHQWHGGNTLSSHIIRLKECHDRIPWSMIKT